MILGRRILRNVVRIQPSGKCNQTVRVGQIFQSYNKCMFSEQNKDKQLSFDEFDQQDVNKPYNFSNKRLLDIQHESSRTTTATSKNNKKSSQQVGILSDQQQGQLYRINKIMKSTQNTKDDQNSDDELENAGVNNISQNEIKQEVAIFMGIPLYEGRNQEQFLQFLNMCNAENVKHMSFSQACALILEIGRNPHRKKLHFVYKKSLKELMNCFIEKSPIEKLCAHIIQQDNQFVKGNYSYNEYEFMRNSLPQIIIALQNCGYFAELVLQQYYTIFSSKGYFSSGVYIKTCIALMWTYIKFDLKGIDYQLFINFILDREKYVYYQNALRLLWICTTQEHVVSEQQFSVIKQLFLDKLAQQNYLIFNTKNSTQILQIIYKLYPEQAQFICSDNQQAIQQLCESDNFFKTVYPYIKMSQEIMRYKQTNQQSYKIIIYDQKNRIKNEHIKKQIVFNSKFEMNVLSVLKNMNPSLVIKEKVYVGDAYEIDFLIESHNIAIEINGASHYYYDQKNNSNKLFINSQIKSEVLKCFGIKHVVNINQFDWYKLKTVEEMESYILSQLKLQDIDTSIFSNPNQSNAEEKNKVKFFTKKLQDLQ